MNRFVLGAGAAAVLAAGLLAPAGIASAATAPTPPPRHVAVSGSADAATVTWAAPSVPKQDPITGYTVRITPKELQPNGGVDTFGPHATSDRFGYLHAGETYTFAVRVLSKRGASKPATVTYTVPKPTPPHVESLYAQNAAGNVVRRPVAGGSWTTITGAGAGWTVDTVGTVDVVSSDGTSIVAHAEDGSAHTLATGLAVVGRPQVDAAEDLFFEQGTSIVKLAHGASTVTTVAPATTSTLWVVAPDGTVTATGSVPGTPRAAYFTYPASGAPATYRETGPYSFPTVLEADASGNVFAHLFVTGGGGQDGWSILPAGATSTFQTLSGPEAAGALASDGDFFWANITTWCAGATEGLGTCTADRTAPTITRRAADGTVTSKPVTGLVLGAKGAPGSQDVSAADVANDVFIDIVGGPDAGLVEVPAAGGAVRQLDTAQYTGLLVR